MRSVVFLHVMMRVSIIIILDKDLWGMRVCCKITNRIFRGNRDGRRKYIRGIAGYFIWSGTILNGNGREIQT